MTNKVSNNKPIIFDIGANISQTTNTFRKNSNKSTVHSFETNPRAFEALNQTVKQIYNVQIWNAGVGTKTSKITFFENSKSDITSFIKLDKKGWEIETETIVQLTTIDAFCKTQHIDTFDILKIDKQGFEFEFIKGTEHRLAQNGIGLIFCEVIFSKMYKNSHTLEELYRFLVERSYKLLSIYKIFYQNKIASWSALIFIHESPIFNHLKKIT
jgi:FkbM family methyltransferase